MRIVLYRPEIPANTGNSVRTCNVTSTPLTLVRPLGFYTSNTMLKRAGLDYWDDVDITYVDDFDAYLEEREEPFYFFSSRADQIYTDVAYTSCTMLIFGSETSGLPDYLRERWPDRWVTIPMVPQGGRCLNLANSVAIALYEVWRQQGFRATAPN